MKWNGLQIMDLLLIITIDLLLFSVIVSFCVAEVRRHNLPYLTRKL